MKKQTRHHHHQLLLLVVVTVFLSSCQSSAAPFQSGCADGSSEGLQSGDSDRLAACDGRWTGHVSNASALCAGGWTVCGWDTHQLLRTLHWNDAMTLPGCYALNAAHDAGQCRPCYQGNLAGIGSGCPHRSYGSDSCISGGQMDVTCCTNSSTDKSCNYIPGLVTGVVCCRQSGELPRIVIHPASLTHVRSGEMFVLSCQAVGWPVPRIYWMRDGQRLPLDVNLPRRIAAFHSGYLIVSQAQPSDSGVYKCLASNSLGNSTAPARVVVTDHSSGCADGTTDGLAEYEEVQACTGRWEGHVKRGRTLCAAGWQVCSPRHSSSLTLLTWTDVTQLPGCYAYNAANSLNLCSVCRRGEMAGVGRDCGRHRPGRRSCLADGVIDVLTRRSANRHRQRKPCNFVNRITTGVLCCKRPEKWQRGYYWSAPKCRPACQNGGVCMADGLCQCAPGYKGTVCQNPVCPGGCMPNAECVRPSLCRCLDGFAGPKCKWTPSASRSPGRRVVRPPPSGTRSSENKVVATGDSSVTQRGGRCRCLNGGRCVRHRCKCLPGFTGARCRIKTERERDPTKTNEAMWPPRAQSQHEINRTE